MVPLEHITIICNNFKILMNVKKKNRLKKIKNKNQMTSLIQKMLFMCTRFPGQREKTISWLLLIAVYGNPGRGLVSFTRLKQIMLL